MTARRGSIRHDVTAGAVPPTTVWALVGDPARLHEWFPGIESCTVDGIERVVVTTRSGLPMPEQLLTVDHTLRRLQYRITAPMFARAPGHPRRPRPGRRDLLVVYSTDADPAALALVIGGAARAALAQLARTR